jgi:hypothetical protein
VKGCWIGVSLSLGSTGVQGLYDRLEEKNKVGLGILFLVGYWHPKMLALDILIDTETMRLLNTMNFEAQIKVGIFKVSPNGIFRSTNCFPWRLLVLLPMPLRK